MGEFSADGDVRGDGHRSDQDGAATASSNLKTDLGELTLANPLVLLSGCVGFGDEYTRVRGFSPKHAGAVCLKGTTLHPRLGNEPPRVCETPAGMINSIGLQNPGGKYVVDKILPGLDYSQTQYIANLSGATIEEYAQLSRLFDQTQIAALEINISCPNVKEGGVAFGNDPDMSARVVEACRANTSKPLIAKLSPNQTDIALNAARCISAGANALSVVNTFMGMAIDIESRKPRIGSNMGGVSGPAIKPLALLKVHQVHQVARPHGVPIIGQGGITNAEDALEFIIAGASAVGVGTALFYDPLVCEKMCAGISEYMQRHGVQALSELIGTVSLNQGAEAWREVA